MEEIKIFTCSRYGNSGKHYSDFSFDSIEYKRSVPIWHVAVCGEIAEDFGVDSIYEWSNEINVYAFNQGKKYFYGEKVATRYRISG